MEAMTLATKICLINNGVLQQYAAPLDVYNHPENLFVADFVGNPSINFIDAKGSQGADGKLELTVLGDVKIKFVPNKNIDIKSWQSDRDKEDKAAQEAMNESMKDKKAVEKSNKDEKFKYHIALVEENDYSIEDEPAATDEDFVIGVRPEFLKLSSGGTLKATVYGAMPTGMESTVKMRIGNYLLTGVIFGGVTFNIGTQMNIDIQGDDILLFDKKSGKCITAGRIEF
jgi:ABC-type sugar transport system ATPase subunit